MLLNGTGATVIAVVLVEALLGLIFVALRTWARLRLMTGLKLDDYTLFISQIFLIVISALCIAAAFEGLGRHSSALNHLQTVQLNKLVTIALSFVALALATSKATVAGFLLIIVVRKWHKAILWTAIATLAIDCVFNFVAFYVQCLPVESVWDPSIPHTCHINITLAGTLIASYGTFLDFFLAALPWFFLRNLHMKPKDKMMINLSLSAGILAGICGVIRVTKAPALAHSKDYSHTVVPLLLWSTTELTVTIMCVCVPATRPMWRRYVQGLSSSSGGISHAHGGYHLSGRSTTANGNNTVTVTAGGGIQHSKQPDNQSDEIILSDEYRSGIRETRSVVVEYDDPSANRSERSMYFE